MLRSRLSACAVALALIATAVTGLPLVASAAPAEEISVPLPDGLYVDMAVDDEHRRIYAAASDPSVITVADFDGVVTGTIAARPIRIIDLQLSPDGSKLYVSRALTPAIDVIDTATLTLTTMTLPERHCPQIMTFTGGRLWFTYSTCDTTAVTGSIAAHDPGTGELTESGLENTVGWLWALPDHPERVVQYDYRAKILRVLDLSGDVPAEKVRQSTPGCRVAKFFPGAERVLLGCGTTFAFAVYETTGLTPVMTVPGGMEGAAVSSDGRHLATYTGGVNAAVTVMAVDGDRVTPVREISGLGSGTAGRNSIAFTRDERLIVLRSMSGENSLHIHSDPFVAPPIATTITAALPHAVGYRRPLIFTGALNNAPASPVTLTLSRTDRAGVHDLGTVTTEGDGTFQVGDDFGTVTGPVTYSLAYSGDDHHEPSSWTGTVTVRPLPFDFNADGYPETVVGTLGEDDGSIMDTGQVHVFPGTPAGVTASGSLAFDQNAPGIPGDNRPGDQFGAVTASGDFDGDGYADLVIGAPGLDGANGADTGSVTVVYGSPAGLDLTSAKGPNQGGVKGERFGHALAVGDFDGDGRDDFAAGSPGMDSGEVTVYRGMADRTLLAVAQFSQDTADVPGSGRTGDAFGWSLASGDVGKDGYDDLAIGAPQDTEDKGWSTGSVTLLYGGAKGLTGLNSQRLTKETADVPGTAGPHNPATGDGADEFGLKIAMGDLNGDGRADLAVSAPGTNVVDQNGKLQPDAGSVTALYSNGRIVSNGSTEITQNTEGIIGLPYNNDFFGDTIAIGDPDGDGHGDLAIFSYGDEYVTVTPSTTGLQYARSTAWTQESPGVPGSHEAGDKWGASLRFLGGARPALIVGAPGEDSQQGAFTVMYIGLNGPTGEGSQYFGEGSPGVPGEPENGDRFGTF